MNSEWESDTIAEVERAIRHSEEVAEEEEVEEEETPPPTNALEKMLRVEGSVFLETELNQVLARTWADSGIKDMCVGLSYAEMARLFLEVSSNMCNQCFYPKDRCMCRTQIGKATGLLVWQIMILYRIDDRDKYATKLHSLNDVGGYRFVTAELHQKHELNKLYSACVAKHKKHGTIDLPRYAYVTTPHMEFGQHLRRLFNSKANIFDLVFGKKYTCSPELYEPLAGIMEASFADSTTVKSYSAAYDTGTFTTASREMIQRVAGTVDIRKGDPYLKMSVSTIEQARYVVLLLWCLFTEKVQLLNAYQRLVPEGSPPLDLFPVFFYDISRHRVCLAGKRFAPFIVVMNIWMRGLGFVPRK